MNRVDDVSAVSGRWILGGWLLVGLVLLGCVLQLSAAEQWVLARTALLGVCAGVLALPLGLLIVWCLQSRGRVSRILGVGALALVLLPLLVQVSGWDAAFGKLGWLTAEQGQVLVPLVSGWWAAVWIHGLAAGPQVALLLWFGAAGRRRAEEQALLDADGWTVFWRVTVPRLLPLLGMAQVWVMLVCAREISVTDLYQVGTVAEQVYLGYSLNSGSILGKWSPDQLEAAASLQSGLVLLTIMLTAWLGWSLFAQLTSREWESGHRLHTAPESTLLQAATGVGLLLLLWLVPLVNILLRACFEVQLVNGVPTPGYRWQQLFTVLRRSLSDYHDEVYWSTMIALTTATLLMLGGLVGYGWARRSRLGRVAFVLSLALAGGLPGPVIGSWLADLFSACQVAWINWLTDYTIFGPVVACAIFCWPVGGTLVWFLTQRTPQDALEATRLEGATAFQRFWTVSVQGNLGALLGGWVLLFALSFGELSASQMVRPAGMDTVPRKMLGDLHAGVNELTAGITLILLAGTTMVSLIGWGLIRLNRGSHRQQ